MEMADLARMLDSALVSSNKSCSMKLFNRGSPEGTASSHRMEADDTNGRQNVSAKSTMSETIKDLESLELGTTNTTVQEGSSKKSAAHAVFEITELLEAILLQDTWIFPFKCQRVCRRWRDVIGGSPALQEKMFLRTSGRPVVVDEQHQLDEPQKCALKLCPELERRRPPTPWEMHCHDDAPVVQSGEVLTMIRAPSHLTSSSSWNNLYLTSPPVTRVWASMYWNAYRNSTFVAGVSYYTINDLEDPTGWTIGKLIKKAVVDRKGDARTFGGSVGDLAYYFPERRRPYVNAADMMETLRLLYGVDRVELVSCLVKFRDPGAGKGDETLGDYAGESGDDEDEQ